MTTVLSPYIAYDPTETSLSFAARLARFHTGISLRRLLDDLGVRIDDFTRGEQSAVFQFAERVGELPERLIMGTIRVLRRYNQFRGHDFSKGFLAPVVRRYCPHCLAEDGDAENWKHRLLWCVRPVCRCPVHETMLVNCEDGQNMDIRDAVCPRDVDHRQAPDRQFPPSEWVTWLAGQIEGKTGEGWLADQSWEHVLAASEAIGAVLEFGHEVRVSALGDAERDRAVETGFTFYREGEAAIREALDEIRSRSGAQAVQAGPLAYYGSLYDWLDRRSNIVDPGPIRALLREHILDHMAAEPGERILGEEVEERRLYTVQSLAETLGVDRRRMSRLLKKLGLIPDQATDLESGNMVFPVAEVEQLLSDFRDAIPLHELSDYIGASRSQAEGLYREGVLSPVIPPNGRGSVRRVVFARRVLDDFLDWIAGLVEDEEEGLVSIADACRIVGGTSPQLIKALRKRTVSARRRPRRHGVAAIVVDLDEVRSWQGQGALNDA